MSELRKTTTVSREVIPGLQAVYTDKVTAASESGDSSSRYRTGPEGRWGVQRVFVL